jgi:hypothetical protein
MNIPHVPVVADFGFKGVAQHQLRQLLAAEIYSTCDTLIKTCVAPAWQEMFRKYQAAIDPGAIRDPTRLPPYATQGPNDPRGVSKIGCVYARLSWVLKLYWDLCLDGADNAPAIRQYLDGLRAVAQCGIDKCSMSGDCRHGYWVEIPGDTT